MRMVQIQRNFSMTDKPTVTTEPPAEIVEAIKALREGQQQIDMDGVMVGVSRQALDEVLKWIEAHDD
jgi:hypothetical protein